MTPARALLPGLLVAWAASCQPLAKPPLDLPAPEYETPRGYDLGAPKKAAPVVTASATVVPPLPAALPAAPPP